jgi:AraC-like DNA-binding protein
LAPPLLYLFIVSVINRDFRLKLAHLLHLIPFAVYAVLVITRFQTNSPEEMRQIVEAGGPFTESQALAYSLVLYAQWLAYGAACFLRLRKYRASLKDYLSTVQPWDLAWLNLVLSGFIVARSLQAADHVLWYATEDMRTVVVYYAAQIFFLAFLTVVFLKELKQPEVSAAVEADSHRQKYGKALLSEEQKKQYAERLKRLMEEEKPYLDPLLSLGALARKAAVPAHQLSQVLNTHFRQNFFDFVNSYRIIESQRLLADPNNGKRTILQVVYEAGFSSKSVFNTAFKKHAGMTPSQFRKHQQS